jgi:hypothetical protein
MAGGTRTFMAVTLAAPSVAAGALTHRATAPQRHGQHIEFSPAIVAMVETTISTTSTSATNQDVDQDDADGEQLGHGVPPHATQPPPRWRWYAGCRPRTMILAISQRSL